MQQEFVTISVKRDTYERLRDMRGRVSAETWDILVRGMLDELHVFVWCHVPGCNARETFCCQDELCDSDWKPGVWLESERRELDVICPAHSTREDVSGDRVL